MRNHDLAAKLGCLDGWPGRDAQGQLGHWPQRQELSVDHSIPRAVMPELDNAIANLELPPLNLNESKYAKIAR